LNKNPGPPGWGLGKGPITSSCKKAYITKPNTEPRTWTENRNRPSRGKKDLRIGTWNVRTLYRGGVLGELTAEMRRYKVDIMAIQETRWLGNETFDNRTHTILHSGNTRRHEFRVAFVIDQKVKNTIINFKPINERMCILRIKTRFFNVSLLNIHAETEDKDEATKDAFYQQLEQEYDSIPSNDIKIVIGDLNAKIGRDPTYQHITGRHSLHTECNDNGSRVIDFAASRNMVVSSTQFPRKEIYKWTWTSPGGRYHNQIDHVLIEKRGASSIMNVRSYRGANCDSDHYMVVATYRSRIATNRTEKQKGTPKFNIDALKTIEGQESYQRALEENLPPEISEETTQRDLEDDWEKIKSAVLNAADASIGKTPRQTRNAWFDEECKEKIDEKNRLRKLYLERNTRAKRLAYENARRDSNNMLRRKKREFMNNILLKVEQNFAENNTREAYKGVNVFKKGFKPRTTLCKDTGGDIIADTDGRCISPSC
jgi:endonuclease/exonuclease/phosphatase family metal-dependent hydrolase